MPAGDGVARWSAEAAPSSAASSAPPEGASSSAWSLVARPYPAAADRIRRDCSALNTPVSQKTSQKRARPWAATPGSCSSITDRTYASVPSGRVAELGRHRVRAKIGRDDVDGALAPEPVRHLDESDLRLEVQPVA